MAQGAFDALPAGPTHRRGRSGGANGSGVGISSKLAFWESQRGAGDGSNSSAEEGGQRRPQQQRSTSPEPEGAGEDEFPSPVLAQQSGDQSDDDDSEDEQRRQFLDNSSDDNNNDADDQSPAPENHGEVLANYLPSRTNSYRSDSGSVRSADSSIFGDGTGRRKMPGDESPIAGQGETLANFWSSRANSMRSSRADSIRSDVPHSQIQHSRPSSVRSAELRQPPLSRTNSAYLPSARPSRTHSLLSQASSSLHSVAESEEEGDDEDEGGEAARKPMGEMIARKWKRQVEQRMRSRVVSRRGSEGSESESEREGSAAAAGVSRGRKKQKGSRRERRALRVAAGAAGRS